MKIKSLFSVAMAASLLAACSNEDEWGNVAPLKEGQLRAIMEGASPVTRVGFDVDGDFYWSSNDKLGVQTEPVAGADNTENTAFSEFNLTNGGGTASAVFSGSGTPTTYAVYPYSESHSITGNSLTFNFPANYTYTQVDQDYFTETQGNGNSFNSPMWGTITEQSVTLKHLGGVFCVKIDKMPYTSGTLTLSVDGKRINGDYTVTLADNVTIQAEDVTSTTAQAGETAENEVSISFSGATQDAPGVFYVPMPTGSYETVRVSLSNGSGTETSTVVGNLTIVRKQARKIELQASSLTGESEKKTDLSAAATDLGSDESKTVTVTGEIGTESNEVTIFNSSSSAEKPVTKTLVLENVASAASLTIKDATAGSTSSSVTNEFTLSIPYSETTDQSYEPLDLTVNMPSTTVTLAGNGGKAAYGNVNATTAANTLVLSSGVSVEKVIVAKGNVRVNSGAVLTAIERTEENSEKVIIYMEEGATIPENLDTSVFVVKDVALDDLKSIFANGGEYVLNNDIDIQGENLQVAVGKAVTLDLNGHAITAANGNNSGIVVLGTFTLKDSQGTGVIKAAKKYSEDGQTYSAGLIEVNGSDASMTMQGGNVEAVFEDAVNNGQFGVTVWNGGHFTMTGGKIEAGWYAVSGNGTSTGDVTINGGTLVSTADYALYLPQNGTTTISADAIITGAAGAIGMRNGTLTISGGTLTSEGTGNTGQWSDGSSSMDNAVLNIGGGKTNTYGNCNVTISGGKFVSEGTSVTIAKNSSPKHTVSLSVTGGTFSDPSMFEYLGDNANVTMELSGDLTLEKSILIEKGTATIDLQQHTLTAASTATVNVSNKDRITAIAVKDGAKAVVKNGQIGNDTDALFYGIYAFGSANVTLENVTFGEMVTYAYNGAGDLTASDCTFKGWLSGWSQGGADFTGCTFTIGKAYYPAAICYGNTTFTNCKFFKNGTDADEVGEKGANDNGYYSYNYVVAIANPATTIDFNSCKFIDANNGETAITVNDHPYHACGDWGDGQLPAESQIQVDDSDIQSQCYGFSQESSEVGDVTE